MKTNLIILAAMLFASTSIYSQKLGSFKGLTEKTIETKMGSKTVKAPYTDITSYLGYAEKDSEDAVVDGKKYTYLYVWIPAAAPELGVRMMSPAGAKVGAKLKNATKSANYDDNAKSKEFFDTYITLERSSIISLKDISAEKIAGAKWKTLAKNDDSSEMPAQPSKSKYNSLLRVKSEIKDPLKALTVGLYRVGFTTYKKGEVKGTFVAQIGAPIKLPGIIVTKNIEDLKKAAK
jgi:Surface lipoprotein of Spirochaetales order